MQRVAELFYRRQHTKQEIANEENIDGRKVSTLLTEARLRGIVKIEILDLSGDDLPNRLLKKFPHLQKVLIVPGSPINGLVEYVETLKRFAVVAADYFEHEAEQRHAKRKLLRVGISGGETLLEFVNAVPERRRPNVHIHTTALIGLGGRKMSVSHVDPATNAMILWGKKGRYLGQCHFATVTPYDNPHRGHDSRKFIAEQIKLLAKNTAIKPILQGMDQIDIAFTAIGTLNPPVKQLTHEYRNRMTMVGVLEPLVSLKEIAAEGAVADLSYCLIDRNGESDPKWEFFLTAGYFSQYRGIAFYRHMVDQGKKVVAIAGPYKVPAISAALRAKAFNVWITDEDSARQIADNG
jgi:DNA-binding transcriptional regulator LsrR (DeoR family)